MHDIKAIRADPAGFDAALARRGSPPAAAAILEADQRRKAIVTALDNGQAALNDLSRRIGQARRAGEDTAEPEEQARKLRAIIAEEKAILPEADRALTALLAELPNVLDPAVPDGADEKANVEQKRWGAIRHFPFAPRQHFEIGEALGLMDFANAAKLAGARFTVLTGALARLERALGQFMLDLATVEHGYTEIVPPLLVNDATMYGTGQLPKFAEDLFKTTDGRWLIPTAEVPLTNIAAGEILPGSRLPLRLAALTPCFRSEAGSAGRDVRGMLRQHQFAKVEMVSITAPRDSAGEHERMTRCAEIVLERLGLPYRRMLLCAGDTGFAAARTYDLEVWLPGQGMYREISSCSNMGAFQARRMNARMREAEGSPPGFVHTLNGSGVAVGRALIAVLENYQQADGSVTVPEALLGYMGGLETIEAA